MYVCMYMYVCICMCVCVYVCICVIVYVGMYVCMYVCMYICMYVCMYVCLFVCLYVYVYVYIHKFMYGWMGGIDCIVCTYRRAKSTALVLCIKGSGAHTTLPSHFFCYNYYSYILLGHSCVVSKSNQVSNILNCDTCSSLYNNMLTCQ